MIKALLSMTGIVAVLAVALHPRVHFCAECGARMRETPFSSLVGDRKATGVMRTCLNEACGAVELE